MKTQMKKIFYILLSIVLFASCDKEKSELLPNEDEVASSELAIKNVQNSSKGFEGSVPVWQYYSYRSSTSADHYFTGSDSERPRPETYGTSKTIKGSSYKYEYSDFNVMHLSHPNTKPLYRFYSPSGRVHRLSTATLKSDDYYKDYVGDGIIGYVYTYQYPGTIPLREKFVIPQKEYNYVSLDRAASWGDIYMPGQIRDLGIIGYVFPGKRSEFEGRVANVINIFCDDPFYGNTDRYLYNQPIVTIKVTIREQIKPYGPVNTRVLTYNELYNEKIKIELAGAYTIQKINATIKIKDKKNIQRTEVFDLYPSALQQWYPGKDVIFWVTTTHYPSLGIQNYYIIPSQNFKNI